MPNWCRNRIRLEGEAVPLARAAQAIRDNRLCQEYAPLPEELESASSPPTDDVAAERLRQLYGYPDWYEFCQAEWGCKWDISSARIWEEGDRFLVGSFETPWAPPHRILSALQRDGLIVTLNYFEGGVGFCGQIAPTGDTHFDNWRDAPPEWVACHGVDIEFLETHGPCS